MIIFIYFFFQHAFQSLQDNIIHDKNIKILKKM
jgi:hypothetical protein